MKRENYPRCFRRYLSPSWIIISQLPKKENLAQIRYLIDTFDERLAGELRYLISSRERKSTLATSWDWRRSRARSARFPFFLFLKRYRTQYLLRAQESLSRDAWRWKIIRRKAAISVAGRGKVKLVEEKRKPTWNLSSSSWVFFPSLCSYPVFFSLYRARDLSLAASFLVFFILPSRAL